MSATRFRDKDTDKGHVKPREHYSSELGSAINLRKADFGKRRVSRGQRGDVRIVIMESIRQQDTTILMCPNLIIELTTREAKTDKTGRTGQTHNEEW